LTIHDDLLMFFLQG